jgi:hypothetical protein
VAATPSIKVIKSFPYRGGSRTYSNRYHFSGGTPPDSTHWTTLSDAIVTAEKAMHFTDVTIIETVGYAAGSDVPVFSKVYSTAGTASLTGMQLHPGEVAMLVRYSTASRTSKNHPLYLFNYYHHQGSISNANCDYVGSGTATPAATYSASWITGFSDGATTYHRAGPNGDVATGSLIETNLTHRDFPK